jgi:hypothetical protein
MITTNLTGNLGNHMWQYSVCRAVAQKLGYEWGINPSPTHDYHNGMNQMYFMDVDFGKPIEGIINDFHEKWSHYLHNGDNVNITKLDERVFSIPDNTRLIGDNGAFGGIYQSEDYLIEMKPNILNWFKIKQEYIDKYEKKIKELSIVIDDNLCILNFRGGEYQSIPNVILRREYWRDSINHMVSINPNMKFLVVTDDPNCAKMYMPFDIPTIHDEIGFDFYLIYKAKWLIISNSTFGWWPAWLNQNVNKVIAPKYWSRHNVSDGYWATGDVYTRGFTYMDRDGQLIDYQTCKNQALEYYKSKNLI